MSALNSINKFVSKLSASAVLGTPIDQKYHQCSVFTDTRGKLKFNDHYSRGEGAGYTLTRIGNKQELMNIKANMLIGIGELKFLLDENFDCMIGSEDGMILGKIVSINDFTTHQAVINGEPTEATVSKSKQKEILTVIKKGLQGRSFNSVVANNAA